MNWRSIGDCSVDQFAAALAGTAVEIGTTAGDLYRIATPNTILLLAQLKHESNNGSEGIATNGSHNPLGLRPRGGGDGFLSFSDWPSAIREWAHRITDPTYAYAKTTTVEDYVHTYAPASDGNNEQAYVATIVAYAAKYAASGASTGEPSMTVATLPVHKEGMLPIGFPTRSGAKLDLANGPLGVTVHETANHGAGASAKMHATVWQHSQDAINSQVSVHLYVDDIGVWQCLPLDEIGWHAGDGCNDVATDVGCFRTVAIERADNSDMDRAKANENLSILMSMIAAGDPALDWGGGATRGKFDNDHYFQHVWVSQEIPPHHCPQEIIDNTYPPMDWNWLMSRVDVNYPRVVAFLHPSTTPTTTPAPTPKPVNHATSPVPGIPLAKGLTTAYLKRAFAGNDSGVVQIGTAAHAFDPNDAVSRTWLRRALASIPKGKDYTEGKFPALVGLITKAGGKGQDARFSDGSLISTATGNKS